jgi:hypothetical protein
MAVRAICGAHRDDIWHRMSYAEGLQYFSLWWMERNHQRQISAANAFGKVPEIEVLAKVEHSGDPGQDNGVADLVV